MKITQKKLQRIIREETRKVIQEQKSKEVQDCFFKLADYNLARESRNLIIQLVTGYTMGVNEPKGSADGAVSRLINDHIGLEFFKTQLAEMLPCIQSAELKAGLAAYSERLGLRSFGPGDGRSAMRRALEHILMNAFPNLHDEGIEACRRHDLYDHLQAMYKKDDFRDAIVKQAREMACELIAAGEVSGDCGKLEACPGALVA